MEVTVGKLAGYCFGVNNAITKTKELLNQEKEIYCLGELIHNGQVIEQLQKDGLITVETIEEVPNNSKLILRAHGVPPEIYKKVKEKQIKLYDLTCPKVIELHKKVEEYKKDSYIFLIGKRNHPEIIGTQGFAGDNCYVIENEEDINEAISQFKESGIDKLYIAAQTTASVEKFKLFSQIIQKKLKEYKIEINNSICESTRLRQEETYTMSQHVDYMIIIGGQNSSNTLKLFEIAKENCKSVHIQTAEQLNMEEIRKYNKIGISAGASTPKVIIEKVKEKIS